MIEPEELRFRKGDALAIALVVFLAAAVFLCFFPDNSGSAAYAEIYLNGQLIRQVSLQEDQVFTVESQYTNEITVKDGTIAITHSDCPGQDCVHSTGRILVCLPNGLEIRVTAEPDDVDFVVG